jgi:TolB-like protein
MSEVPPETPTPPLSKLGRVWSRAQRLRRPLLVVAGVGAVLSGLAGYWNAWRVVKDVSSVAAAPGTPEPAARTLAVLAFANLGDDPAFASFGEGVGEELVDVLSRVKGLRVTARRSALRFKGQSVPMIEIASQLQTSYLVDGSVRRDGERVRIGAQLVDGRSGAVLWSGMFERDMKDALAAQGELALQIARSLKLPLDAATVAGSGTKNVQAWQLFFQAQRMPPGKREPLLQQALALDPKFARAHVALAEEAMAGDWSGRDASAIAKRMVPHLQAALRVDPRSALAYGRLATAAALSDDIEAMRRYAKQALEIDPGDMAGHNWSSELAWQAMRVDEALAERRTMCELEPLGALPRIDLAAKLRLAQQPAQALVLIDQALLLQPASHPALIEKGFILLALGRRDEALALARRFDWVEIFGLAGSSEDLAAVRQRSGLGEHQMAALALFEGRYDVFFDHFEKDHTEFIDRSKALFDPVLDHVRDHPRFKAYLARYGIEDSQRLATAWRAANPAPR